MIKFAVFCICGLFLSQSVMAQLASSNLNPSSYSENEYKRNNIGLDVNFITGNNNDGFGLGVRYLYKYNPYVGWDVLGVKAITNYDIDAVNVQVMTGIRAITPQFNKVALYGNARCGYGCNPDDDFHGGFCSELGGGVILNNKYYIGYAYSSQHISEYEITGHYDTFIIGINF